MNDNCYKFIINCNKLSKTNVYNTIQWTHCVTDYMM